MNFCTSKETKKLPGRQLTLYPIEAKRVELNFNAEKTSSDGGALLLKEVEAKIGVISGLADAINDNRHQSYVDHSYYELLSQRIIQIACGYEDGNDCDDLKDDAVMKMCAGRLPETGNALGSQPTISRLENAVSRTGLYRMAQSLATGFIKSYSKPPKVIILDFDDTNNDTHGGQQLSLFNSYYHEYCYLPLHVYEGLSGKLVTTLLKPGRRSKNTELYAIAKRLIEFIEAHWPQTHIIIRGDSHFTSHPLMDWAEDKPNVSFATGLSGNQKLNKIVEQKRKSAERIFARDKKPVKCYHSFTYKAGSWNHLQRVVAKIEVTERGTNIRFVVTDMVNVKTRKVYEEIYCARGNMELRIKDHKTYLKSNRSSCTRFEANQFRLFLHSAAYVLIHALQTQALKATEFARSTMRTIQLKVLKVAAHVKELGTKIKVSFPCTCPQREVFEKSFGIFQILRC